MPALPPPSILFLLRKPPYAGLLAAEQLDIMLVAAAYELPIALLFRDAGIWQLAREQQAHARAQKSVAKQLSALPMYDVTALYVDQEALSHSGLGPDDLCLPVKILNPAEQRALLAGSAVVIND